LRFDLSSYFSLLEAFDQTGRRIYGSAWQGDEAFARTTIDPEPTRVKRTSITERLRAIGLETRSIYPFLGTEFGAEENQRVSDQLGLLERERSALNLELKALPHLTDYWIKDHEAFDRRMTIENHLSAGFKERAMTLYMGPNSLVDWNSWSRHRAFKVYFGLSMVRSPHGDYNSRRRGPAFVNRVEFADWLERFELKPDDLDPLTPAGKCEVWLREQVRVDGTKSQTKERYRTEAIAKFTGLSVRSFDRVWDKTVPPSWKQSGPKRKTK
jgi:hypothetical protein